MLSVSYVLKWTQSQNPQLERVETQQLIFINYILTTYAPAVFLEQ